MPKTYTAAGSATAGDVYTAAAHNIIVTDVNNFIVPPACRLQQSAAQTVPDSTTTALAFGNEIYDTDGMHDNATNNSRITIQTAGIYIVTASVGYTSTPTAANELYIQLGGSTRIVEDSALSGAAYKCVSVTYAFSAADYIEVIVYADGPRTTRYASLPGVTHFAATWIGRTS